MLGWRHFDPERRRRGIPGPTTDYRNTNRLSGMGGGWDASVHLLRLSIFFEQTQPDGVPAYGIAIDLSKAFDNIPIEIVFAVCRRVGLDEGLWRGSRGMYARIQRRFKIGGYVGEAFKDTKGIVQGCSLSVLLFNFLMAVLTAVLKEKVRNESYVEDLTLLSSNRIAIQQAMDLIGDFMNDTGQTVNLKKTKAFGTRCDEDFTYEGRKVEYVDSVKILGTVLGSVDGRMSFSIQEGKVDAAVALANRIWVHAVSLPHKVLAGWKFSHVADTLRNRDT